MIAYREPHAETRRKDIRLVTFDKIMRKPKGLNKAVWPDMAKAAGQARRAVERDEAEHVEY
jgi:hypothetical protein